MATPAGELVGRIYPQTGRAYLVGVTGAPGDGKSTLVDRLIAEVRQRRIEGRRDRRGPDEPVLRRSGARRSRAHERARGRCGRVHPQHGDARTSRWPGTQPRRMRRSCSTRPGSDIVIIETVGVGQDEVDIVSAADISIVVLVPGAGDDVQAIKAGVMEIADIFVVNKADREGADRVVQAVASNLSLKTYSASEWRPPILKTEATTGVGVDVLWKESGRFREWAERASAAAPAATARVEASRSPGALVPAPRRAERCLQRSSIAISRPLPAGPAIHTQWLKRS